MKYIRGRKQADIEIGAMESKDEVTFHVRDNGVGFEMDHVGKWFGVFQRLHAASQFEGIGIGLANVRRIIHGHGGRVWAEGAVDKGATFFSPFPKNRKEPYDKANLDSPRGRSLLEMRETDRGILNFEIPNSKSIGLLGVRERATLLGAR